MILIYYGLFDEQGRPAMVVSKEHPDPPVMIFPNEQLAQEYHNLVLDGTDEWEPGEIDELDLEFYAEQSGNQLTLVTVVREDDTDTNDSSSTTPLT